MDVYGLSTAQDYFRIDDLLDFSNEEIFSSASTSTSTFSVDLHHYHHLAAPSENPSASGSAAAFSNSATTSTTDFTDDLCVPSDDVAELEWLSRFVDDSFSDFPSNSLTGEATLTFRSDMSSFTSKSRTKRSKAANNNWTSSPEPETPATGVSRQKQETNSRRHWSPAAAGEGGGGRRCTHCSSEKTPQWRTGPLGAKTLCNACGVRFKSGRLVPEYRPAASPTFVLTQHSNSHRKVLELRRQKELLRQQHQLHQHQQEEQQSDQMHMQAHMHRLREHDFEVC